MVSTNRWVILFGGAGRESCVERMLEHGVNVQAIIVPARRNPKLERAVEKLRLLSCTLVEVEKTQINETLRVWGGSALLSIGFPYLISSELLELFHPALNLHPTLLPNYRGPTTGAYILLNDERESGSTVHHMTAGMDRGDIVAQSRVALTCFDTIRSLQRKVYAEEPQLVINALTAIESGTHTRPQDESMASEYPKRRTPADSEVDPTRPLIDLFNHIRACDPQDFPAFFIYNGERVCIRLWRPDKSVDAEDEI